MEYNANKIIEKLVNISEITNKWMMWCESNTPDKSVFVPSIFQMRDAYSHMIKLFGKGYETGYLTSDKNDFNALFNDDYSMKQLEEAFTHSTRAFYDCADYILLVIKQELDDCKHEKSPRFIDLRSKLLQNDKYITELRSAKSEDIDGNYENIQKWDLFLQLITSSYSFADYELELLKLRTEIYTKLNLIENKISPEIIKNHEPQFYEKKSILVKLETLPVELQKYIEDDGVVSKQLLENSQDWCNDIVTELKNKIKEAEEYSSFLDGLQKIMANSNNIQKRKSFIKTCWGFLSAGISWGLTNFLSSNMLTQQVINQEGTVESTTVDMFNLKLFIPFILGAMLIFALGLGAIKLISKIFKYK